MRTQRLDTLKDKSYLGFWLYLMTDAMLFASLFATFMILRHSTNGGATSQGIFELPFVMVETVVLLISSVTCGIAYLALKHGLRRYFAFLLIATIILGEVFIGLELYELRNLATTGRDWSQSAFLSSYFTLVGLHGLHVFFGLIWGAVVGLAVLRKVKTSHLTRKFGLFTLFWHFLDIIWIFIFTIVYVLGVI